MPTCKEIVLGLDSSIDEQTLWLILALFLHFVFFLYIVPWLRSKIDYARQFMARTLDDHVGIVQDNRSQSNEIKNLIKNKP